MIECFLLQNVLFEGQHLLAGTITKLPVDVYEHLRERGCIETTEERRVRADASERMRAIESEAAKAAEKARADVLAQAQLEAEQVRADAEEAAARTAAEEHAKAEPKGRRHRG